MKGFERFLVRKSLLGRTVIPKITPIDEKRGLFLSSFRAISSSAMRSHTPISFLNPWKPASFLQPNSDLWGSFTGQKRSLFIQTQSTPNPSSLMFFPGKPVMEVGSVDFPNARTAMSSTLAKSIFAIDGMFVVSPAAFSYVSYYGTTRVFFGSDFVTVTKSDEASWDYLKPEIFAAIMDFYTSGSPLFLDSHTAASKDTAINEMAEELAKDDSEIVAMIKELLETRIRPAVQDDGGDIEYRGFDEETGMVKLRMQGACSGCPSSSVTLKSGIENMLMHYIPEVKGVEQELENEENETKIAS